MITSVVSNFGVSLIILCCTNVFGTASKVGDSCLINSTNGVCKWLTNCLPALQLFRGDNFPEEILCSYEGTKVIVCCEDTSSDSKPVVATPEPKKKIPPPEIVDRFKPVNREPGQVSKEKCKEYSKYAWDESSSPILSVFNRPAHTYECPFDQLPLVVGGTLATRQEFPHMVVLGYIPEGEVEWDGGGTLISNRYVLTASHCLYTRQKGRPKLVRVGMTNLSDTNHVQEITISEIQYHPEYRNESNYHDIALLKLSKDVDLNIYARPACLHTGKDIASAKAIATGWGKVGEHEESSNDLLKVILDFFDNESCNRIYRRKIKKPFSEISNGILEDTMICVGSFEEIRDTCQGDSGGPLQVYHNDSDGAKCMYDIVGVTSFGKACGLSNNSPGVYTRVSSYIKWIEDTVWPED